MKINHILPLQRVIAKVDNDFNIDNSDWIPRAGAWCIDALSQLKCMPYQWRRVKHEVKDKRTVLCNILSAKYVRIYDEHGCRLDNANGSADITPYPALNNFSSGYPGENSSTGGMQWKDEEIAIYTGSPDIQNRIKVGRICHSKNNFVITGSGQIELDFDANWIVVEWFGPATYYDDFFNEEVPFIYDNGDLLEAVSWYIMYKILSRGYKHQVFSLTGQEPVNPYIQWNKLKDKASASVKHDIRNEGQNSGWNNFFYNSTFLPRG